MTQRCVAMCCAAVNNVSTWLHVTSKKRVLPTVPTDDDSAADMDVKRQNDDVAMRRSRVDNSDRGQFTGVILQTDTATLAKSIAVPRRHRDDKCINMTPDNHITERPLAASSAPATNNTHRTTSRRRVRDAGRQRQAIWNPTENRPAIMTTDARATPTSNVTDVTLTTRRQQTTSESSCDQPSNIQSSKVSSRSPPCWTICQRQSPDKSSATAMQSHEDDVNMTSNDVTNIADFSRLVSSSLNVMTSMDECMASSDDIDGVAINEVIKLLLIISHSLASQTVLTKFGAGQ